MYGTNRSYTGHKSADLLFESKSGLERIPFEGQDSLELKIGETPVKTQIEIDKAGVICVFYICHLPFVRC